MLSVTAPSQAEFSEATRSTKFEGVGSFSVCGVVRCYLALILVEVEGGVKLRLLQQ